MIVFTVFIALVFIVAILIVKTISQINQIFFSNQLEELKNKHVLITGGSSGIGKAVAFEAAKLGANVTIVARNELKLNETQREIQNQVTLGKDQKILVVSMDVTSGLDSVQKVIDSVEELRGPIFLLVNCAGTAVLGDIDQASERDFRHMMDLNYLGTVYPTIAVGRKMKKRKEGCIVITGSEASLLGIYGMSAYCGSKFALRGFAESLHMELKPHNVSVTLCLPPDTNTPGFENEQKSKPEITRLISETAKLTEPDVVAKQLLSDALEKNFFSFVGFEGFLLTTVCAGMSPLSSFSSICLQVGFMGFFRLISVGYLLYFQKIISDYLKMNNKKENKN